MLRDEAIEGLLERLEHDSFGTLRIHADNGEFRASYATGISPVESEWRPVLTDALVSLAEALASAPSTTR